MGKVKIDSAFFTETEQKQYKEKADAFDLKSKLTFLQEQRGVRKGKLHTFISPTGVGKSTFVRTLIRDIIFNNKNSRVLLWLTEETVEEFRKELSKGIPSHMRLMDVDVVSEQDNLNVTPVDFAKEVADICEWDKPDVLIIDNITTSSLYRDSKLKNQSDVATWLKGLTKYGCAVFVIAHTGAEVNENFNKLIDENHIRGAKSITLISEFFYIMQPFYINNSLFQFLRIKKARGAEVEERLFKLNYNKHLAAFENDTKVSFDDFLQLYKLRNRLG
jgi:hypothetical protein